MRSAKRIIAVTLISLLTSGCGLALIGGAGAGGYYVGKDERKVGRIGDDASITTAVNMEYIGDSEVSAFDINVDTYNGVVTLYGSVPDAATARRAVKLAYGVKGVRQVVSKLTVVSPH
ncbi:MAG: BON domain-containing protein [Alphaproteobacteria bacterium]|nr:BON domain-containing protein [Alphaproteobacteria bacterium]